MLRHLAFNVTYNPTNRNDEKERLDSSFVGIQQDLSKRGNRAAQHFYSLPSSGIDARREARGNTFAPHFSRGIRTEHRVRVRLPTSGP